MERENMEAGIDVPVSLRRPVLTPQDVPKGTEAVPVLSTMETWTAYWREKFGTVGAGISALAFSVLAARDNNPSDNLLDLASLRRDTRDDDNDDVLYVFDRLHVLDSKDQPILDQMREAVIARRAQLVSMYAVHHNGQWLAVDEKGYPFAVSGARWKQAVKDLQDEFPDAKSVRLVGDMRFFAGRDANDLNPDRRGSMAGYVLNPRKLMLGGGLGVVDGGLLTVLPFHHFATSSPTRHDPFLSPETLDLCITLFQITLVLLAAAAGKSASGGGVPVMTELRTFGKKMNTLFGVAISHDVGWALTAAQGTRGTSVPTILMMSNGEVRRAPPRRTHMPHTTSGNADYARRFRTTLPPLPAVTPSPPEPVETAPAVPVVRSVVAIPVSPPKPDDLAKVEATFRSLFAQCATDERGFVDTSPLRTGNLLNASIRFADGTARTTEQLLRMHDTAWNAVQRTSGNKQPSLEGSFRSETRLVDIFRRVTGRRDLMPARDRAAVNTILTLDVPKVRLRRAGDPLKAVLKDMWRELTSRGEQLSPRTVRSVMVQAKNGERERAMTLLEVYWKSLQREFAAKGIALPDVSSVRVSIGSLDIMHYQLFGQVRPQSRGTDKVVTVPLTFEAKDPLPEVTSLQGAMSVLYKFSQAPMMAGLDRFPLSPKGSSVILYDPRTGETLNYDTLLNRTHHFLAKAVSDPTVAPALRSIPIDKIYVKDPGEAGRRLPGNATRSGLLMFVQKYRGLPEVTPTSVVRRRGKEVVPVFQLVSPELAE